MGAWRAIWMHAEMVKVLRMCRRTKIMMQPGHSAPYRRQPESGIIKQQRTIIIIII